MTRAAALAEAEIMKGFFNRNGIKCSIELVEGARTKVGWLNPPGTFIGEMSHHIVSHRGQGLTPFRKLVEVGRIDVKGPLCNGYGGFDEVYRIITMGVANHSGLGGPLNVGGSWIPKDMGAYVLWGTEYEGGLRVEDWDNSFHKFMDGANVSVLEYLSFRNPKVTFQSHLEHSTWAPGRKKDRLGYSKSYAIERMTNLISLRDVGAGRTPIVASRGGFNRTPEFIRNLQATLKKLGYYPGLEDGQYGVMTKGAVRAYQEAQEPKMIRADGEWGVITQRYYEWVRHLQSVLNKARTTTPPLTVDGDYRFLTKRKVTNFQALVGLYQDGIAGPRTCNVLGIGLPDLG